MPTQGVNYALAAAVARYVELLDVRLVKVKADLFVSPAEFEKRATVVETAYRAASEHDPDAGRLQVRLAFLVRATASSDDTAHENGEPESADATPLPDNPPKSPLFSLECEMVADYRFAVRGGPQGDELKKHLDAFAGINGVYNLFPYLREHVQSTAGRMGVHLVLPVFRIDASK